MGQWKNGLSLSWCPSIKGFGNPFQTSPIESVLLYFIKSASQRAGITHLYMSETWSSWV